MGMKELITTFSSKNKDLVFRDKIALFAKIKINSQRAVSEIIVTLLLVGITVVAGIIIFSMFSITNIADEATMRLTESPKFKSGIRILGYDTRDGVDLMGISNIDNDSPTNGQLDVGSEFIVLKIDNKSPTTAYLDDIIINDVSHSQDGATALPPSTGKFSIIPGDNSQGTTPQTTADIKEGEIKRVVVALSGSISSNIKINDAIRVSIDASPFDVHEFIITAGNAR